MALPASFLDELRTRISLSGYIGRQTKLTRAGREWKGCCPFHNEKTPSFYVNDDKNFFHCFGCGVHGDLIGFAMQKQGWDFPEAIENLAAEAGMQVPQRSHESAEQVDARTRLYQLLDAAAAFFASQLYAPAGRNALAYLKQRGLSDETIAAWRLGYAPDDAQALRTHLVPKGYSEKEMEAVGLWRQREDKSGGYSFFRGRVMFVVNDRRGRPVAFGARLLAGDGPKYINSPEHALFKKGELLFGADKARILSPEQPLLLVEGYMDVISLAQADVPAVAPLGTAMTEPQALALWQMTRSRKVATPVLCFDGDNAGTRAAVRGMNVALPHIAPDKSLSFCFLPQGEDPDSLVKNRGAAALHEQTAKAMPLIDVLWQSETASHPATTPEGRAALEQALAAQTARIQDAAVRGHYEREIKNRLWTLFNPRSGSNRGGSDQGGRTQGGENTYSNQQKNHGQTFNNRASPLRNTGLTPISRPSGASAIQLRERIMLALIINYPALLADPETNAEAWLLDWQPHNASFAPVCAALIKAASTLGGMQDASLDADSLARYLEVECAAGKSKGDQETAAVLADLLSETTYKHAGFARPGRDLSGAQAGWRDLMAQMALHRIGADMKQLPRDLSEISHEQTLALNEELRNIHDTFSQVLDERDRAKSN